MDQENRVIPQYINAKAGMASVNTESIAKQVAEMTKGTPKDLHEKEMQRKRALEVTAMLEKIMKFKAEDRQDIKHRWEKRIQEMRESRPLDRFWGHFDFDMFYVACELLDKPELKEKPCAVGGENSVLSTANYAARLFGVRAAMPTFIAKKLCPQLILLKPDYQKYRNFSDIFRQILQKLDANLESHGLDEAYIDLTQHLTGKNAAQQEQFVQNIRKDIFDKTQLTVSCGIGPNKMLAKIASDINKPNGQFIIQNKGEVVEKFMKDRKIRKIPGVGPVNEYYLKGLKIETAEEILQNTDILAICFSENSCEFFVSAALGLGSIEHEFKDRKSVGKSQTFKPNSDRAFLEDKLISLCEEVSHEMEELGFVSINVVLSYQFENYEKKDKTINLDAYSKDKQCLFKSALIFLQKNVINLGKKIRLLGVKCTNIIKVQEWKRRSIENYFSKQKFKTDPFPTEKKSVEIPQQKQSTSKKEISKGEVEHSLSKDQKEKSKSRSKQQMLLAQIKKQCQYICPICNTEIQCMNNIAAFNRHIDKCLKSVK